MGSPMRVAINHLDGRAFLVIEKPSKNPFQRKQWIKATVTIKPATFTEKAVTESHMFFLPFMEAVMVCQKRWPKKLISYTTLQVEAAKKPDPSASAAAEKVE